MAKPADRPLSCDLAAGHFGAICLRAKHLVREIPDAGLVDIEQAHHTELPVESAAEYSLSEVSSRVDPKSASNKAATAEVCLLVKKFE